MNKCSHGVYIPEGDTEAKYCTLCNPEGNSAAKVPQFNKRNSLHLTVTGKLPKCPNCDIPLSLSLGGKCRHCGETFEIIPAENLRANNTQIGVCPDCGSGVHYTTNKAKEWECADCGKKYPAPKRVQ